MFFGQDRTPALLPAGWRHFLAAALLPRQRPGEFPAAFDSAVADLFALDDRGLRLPGDLANQLQGFIDASSR